MDLSGRDEELREVLTRLGTRRLVTLTGPGGIGKTALAGSPSRARRAGSRSGSARVDLTVVDDAERVPGTIAAQLGFALLRGADRVSRPSSRCCCSSTTASTCSPPPPTRSRPCWTHAAAPTVLATSRSPLGVPGRVAGGARPAAGAADRRRGQPRAPAVPGTRRRRGRHRERRGAARPRPAVPRARRRPSGARDRRGAAADHVGGGDPRRGCTPGSTSWRARRTEGSRRHRSVTETVQWSYDLLPA